MDDSLKQCSVKETRHKKAQLVLFHLCKVQEQAKPIYTARSQKSHYSWGQVRTEKSTKKGFYVWDVLFHDLVAKLPDALLIGHTIVMLIFVCMLYINKNLIIITMIRIRITDNT